jgi:apolipoprotein N-acyltransferase
MANVLEKIIYWAKQHIPLVAFGAGLLAALGHAPFDSVIVFGLGVLGLLALKDGRFLTGFSFGVGYWIGVLYWIVFAFDVYSLRRLGIASVLLLCCWLSLFQGFAYFMAYRLRSPKISFAFLWVGSEWIQGHMGWLSFPWGYASFTWGSLEILQSVSWIGVEGLSLVTMLGIVALGFGKRLTRGFTVLFFALLWSLGAYRLHHFPTRYYPVNVRLVQPSIAQKDKINPRLFDRNFQLHLYLSRLKGERPLDAIIWPETAFLTGLRPAMKTFLQEFPCLITGSPRREGENVFNSVFLTHRGSIDQIYDKQRLVPFGEYNPLPFIPGFDSFSKGQKNKFIKTNLLPTFRPLICYEAIFPIPVTEEKWRLNLTNDAWYGTSSGPYQHLKIVQIRAIESGIPVIRVANNGISAVIDGYGRMISRLGVNRVGFIDTQIPRA